ncbi:uncharacterized protein LAESUDRAFT_714508 [Laetiporus sulphureus 93-53]|uniref:Uncharacterized protein n=1 Tax=Laetiporus sulphureus 93-53 TaxID=1314785 RepID=A0A165E325_9APHY|nr:uncharacterized protein LAESUDRAFT_714508 [Laetiporus sulphureus 93-53]KZT06147.1 hypothetical protein LAESUDRAFT_714508 [Laetiporus sulphureus 93-53]
MPGLLRISHLFSRALIANSLHNAQAVSLILCDLLPLNGFCTRVPDQMKRLSDNIQDILFRRSLNAACKYAWNAINAQYTQRRHEERIAFLEDRVSALSTSRVALNLTLDNMRTALANGRDEYAVLGTAIVELQGEKAEVDTRLEEARLTIKSENARCLQLENAVAHLNQELQLTRGVLSTERTRCKGLETSVLALEGSRQQLLGHQAVHADKYRVAQEQLSAVLFQVDELLRGKVLLSASLQASQSLAEDMHVEVKTLRDSREATEKTLAKAILSISEFERIVSDLRESADVCSTQLKVTEVELLLEREKLQIALDSVDALRAECEVHKSNYLYAMEDLEDERKALSTAESAITQERAAKEQLIRDIAAVREENARIVADGRRRENDLRAELEEERRQRTETDKALAEEHQRRVGEDKAVFELGEHLSVMTQENDGLRKERIQVHDELHKEQTSDQHYLSEIGSLKTELSQTKEEHNATVDRLHAFEDASQARWEEAMEENDQLMKDKSMLQQTVRHLIESKESSVKRINELEYTIVQTNKQLDKTTKGLAESQKVCVAVTAQMQVMAQENTDLRASMNMMSGSAASLQEARRTNKSMSEELAICRCRKALKNITKANTEELENEPASQAEHSREYVKPAPATRRTSFFWY